MNCAIIDTEDDNMTKDMGQFMQEMRKKKGLTQKELAELIGVSDKTISKWETGKGTPDTSMLVPISEAFNITVNELLSGELIPPENYHVKAEETIMALVKENESTKKGTKISVVIGVIVILAAFMCLGICTVGIEFPISNFMDVPSIIIMILLCVGVVLVSGARTKEKVLDLLKKTVLFVGALISLCSVIVVFGVAPELNTAGIIAANLAVAGLPLLYAMIVRIIVEVMLFRKKYSTPYEVKY